MRSRLIMHIKAMGLRYHQLREDHDGQPVCFSKVPFPSVMLFGTSNGLRSRGGIPE